MVYQRTSGECDDICLRDEIRSGVRGIITFSRLLLDHPEISYAPSNLGYKRKMPHEGHVFSGTLLYQHLGCVHLNCVLLVHKKKGVDCRNADACFQAVFRARIFGQLLCSLLVQIPDVADKSCMVMGFIRDDGRGKTAMPAAYCSPVHPDENRTNRDWILRERREQIVKNVKVAHGITSLLSPAPGRNGCGMRKHVTGYWN